MVSRQEEVQEALAGHSIRVHHLLSSGSFASVYLAFDDELLSRVALKAIPKHAPPRRERDKAKGDGESSSDSELDDQDAEQAVADAKKEALLLSRLNHPHVVGFCKTIDTPSYFFVLLEYCPNGDVLTFVRRSGRLPESVASTMVDQMLTAVIACHEQGIIHRDIKPENFLLDESYSLKLADFGLSFDSAMRAGERPRTPCGSLGYAAPELLRKKEHDFAVDSWSIGVTAYALICGSLPWSGNPKRIVRSSVRGIREFPSYVSAAAQHFISQLTAVDVADRTSLKDARLHTWIASHRPSSTAAPQPAFSPAAVKASRPLARQRRGGRSASLGDDPLADAEAAAWATARAAARQAGHNVAEAGSASVFGAGGAPASADVANSCTMPQTGRRASADAQGMVGLMEMDREAFKFGSWTSAMGPIPSLDLGRQSGGGASGSSGSGSGRGSATEAHDLAPVFGDDHEGMAMANEVDSILSTDWLGGRLSDGSSQMNGSAGSGGASDILSPRSEAAGGDAAMDDGQPGTSSGPDRQRRRTSATRTQTSASPLSRYWSPPNMRRATPRDSLRHAFVRQATMPNVRLAGAMTAFGGVAIPKTSDEPAGTPEGNDLLHHLMKRESSSSVDSEPWLRSATQLTLDNMYLSSDDESSFGDTAALNYDRTTAGLQPMPRRKRSIDGTNEADRFHAVAASAAAGRLTTVLEESDYRSSTSSIPSGAEDSGAYLESVRQRIDSIRGVGKVREEDEPNAQQ